MPPLDRKDRMPPRRLPLLYFGFAHLCLALAFLALAITPGTIGGFFYNARMLAVVHLVTLGWISSSILGAIYLIGPLALRMRIPVRAMDYVAFGLFFVGVAGMVAHFWIDSYSGMVWSTMPLMLGLMHVAGRVLRSLNSAGVPGAVKLHIRLAFFNVVAAGTLGTLVGLEKQMIHVLPGYLLNTVFAHAHLAALGWATMMVMGTGYRLLPMVLPAAMPEGRSLYLSAVLLELGVIGLLVALPARSRWASLFTILTVAGLTAFFYQVVSLKRHARPSPAGLLRPDYGTAHAMQALAYLAVSAALGLGLAIAPAGEWKLQAAMAYGVFSLVGFLSQMVIGISARVLPMFAWMHGYIGSDFEAEPPSQYSMADRRVQALNFFLWTAGVPTLAIGLSMNRTQLIVAAAWGLLLAVVLNAFNDIRIVRHAFMLPSPEGRTPG